jgi:hypothetical protein
LAEYKDWLQAQQKELRGRPLSASAAECPGDERDQPDETVVEPGDWRAKLDEVVDSLRRHGLDGAADEIVRHLPPQPQLTAIDRACEKRDMGELAFSRKEGADERAAVAWLLEYLNDIEGELARAGAGRDDWSNGRTRAEWAKRYGISTTTFDARRNDGTIAWQSFGKLIQIRRDCLPPED